MFGNADLSMKYGILIYPGLMLIFLISTAKSEGKFENEIVGSFFRWVSKFLNYSDLFIIFKNIVSLTEFLSKEFQLIFS